MTTEQEGAAGTGADRDAERVRSWALRRLVHAARTPLSIVAASAEMLHDAIGDPEQARAQAAAVEHGAAALRELLDRLGEVVAWPSGTVERDVDLGPVVRDVVQDLRAEAERRGTTLRLDDEDAAATRVDVVVLRWGLRMLLREALAGTGQGGRVDVELGAVPVPTVDIVARPAAPSSTGADRPGGQTAAAVAREVIARRWGRVEESSDGGDRCVRVVLSGPASVARPGTVERQPSSDTAGPVGPDGAPVVLVVEDDDHLRDLLVRELSADRRVVAARSAEQALHVARAHPPDLVVCDIMLPGASGERLVHFFENHEELADVPVLILTGRTDDDLRVRLLRDGADDYLTKPFSLAELRARLANLAEQRLDVMDLRDEVGQARMLSDDLQRALESRVVIEQAKAFVAAERAIGVEEAFDVLRDHARSHNTRLHDLAVDVVRRHGLRGLA